MGEREKNGAGEIGCFDLEIIEFDLKQRKKKGIFISI